MAKEKKLRILFLAAEADPLVKVGGLGDVAGTLPQYLRSLLPQHIQGYTLDVRLALPFHAAIRSKITPPMPVAAFKVPHPAGDIPAQAYLTQIDSLPVYLVEGAPIPADAPVYSTNNQQDGEKYVFFSLAALELARALDWQPHILHANDWHTALAVHKLSLIQDQDPFFASTRSILSVHNLPFMGAGIEQVVTSFGFSPASDPRLPEWARSFPLPLGLLAADQIIAVSPNYGREILTPAFGCGLQDMLRTRAESICGILNGLDQNIWNPLTDPHLTHNFSTQTLEERNQNKTRLQADLNLPVDPSIPMLIMIGRMDQQKGVDLALDAVQLIIDRPWQLVILGTGDQLLETSARSLELEHPDRIRAIIRFDSALSHRMYASGDMLLMPSRYEPCGLAQMIAMRYGCIPVARATGGLSDTITDTPKGKDNTGFLFTEPNADNFTVALLRALTHFINKPQWTAMQTRAMQKDFSWTQSAIEYAKLYIKLAQG